MEAGVLPVIIGDVHGCLEELVTLHGMIRARASRGAAAYHLVFTGDLVDRGAQPAAVLQYVRRLVAAGEASLVLGNHDEMFLQAVALFRSDLAADAGLEDHQVAPLIAHLQFAPHRFLRHWLQQGGGSTIASFGGDPWRPEGWNIPREDIAFLGTAPLVWHHGAVTVTHGRSDQRAIREALQFLREPWRISPRSRDQLLWNRTPPEAPDSPRGEHRGESEPPRGIHVCGHTARTSVLYDGHVREIDTGCCFGNCLTAYFPEDDTVLQAAYREGATPADESG